MVDTRKIREAAADPTSYVSAVGMLAEAIERQTLLVDDFLLYRNGRLAIYYAPFDHINETAQVILMGVTPGWTQMQLAYATVRTTMANGASQGRALKNVKRAAAFGGTMRRNLTSMLDGIGLPSALGLRGSDDLFGEGSARLHGTSAIRYPVFVDGRNYSGHRPPLLDEPALRWCVDHILSLELDQVGEALLVPLGRAAEAAARRLVELNALAEERVLYGFPHPSGAYPGRLGQYEANRDSMAEAINRWFSSS